MRRVDKFEWIAKDNFNDLIKDREDFIVFLVNEISNQFNPSMRGYKFN